MKKIIGTILITVLLCGMAGIAYAETWQETLEGYFNIVQTFDNLDDYRNRTNSAMAQCSGGGGSEQSLLPKKTSDGTPSGWDMVLYNDKMQSLLPGEDPYFIDDHGEYSIGSKSLALVYDNFCGGEFPKDHLRDLSYGAQKAIMYLPDDNAGPTSGYSEIYIFYRVKWRYDKYNMVSGRVGWIKSANGTNEYYYAVGTPGVFKPFNLFIDSKPIKHMNAGKLGSLSAGSWGYGDNDSLGYYTVYVRLIDGADPDTKAADYLKYENGFFTIVYGSPDTYNAWAKHLQIESGFYNACTWGGWNGSDCFYDGQETCGDRWGPICWEYGNNFIALNFSGGASNGPTFYSATPGYAKDGDGCWTFQGMDINWDFKFYNSFDSKDFYTSKKWWAIEIYAKTPTLDAADGVLKVWVYDEDGNVVYDSDSQSRSLSNLDWMHKWEHKINKITFGGNKINSGYQCDDTDTWDNRWYLDDVILDNQRIGPTYFALLKNQPVIVTSSLSKAIANQSYSQTLQASGGTLPYTWQTISGSLPQGLTLNGATGEISGIPAKEGVCPFTIEVRDAESKTASRELTLIVTIVGISCDINADGIVNVLDLQLCVNVVLGISPPFAVSPLPNWAWDADKNGKIDGDDMDEMEAVIVERAKTAANPLDECNVLDIQAVVNVILNSV